MSNIFISSDPHFDHANILTFLNPDGSRMREFASVEEMNEHIIEEHNKVVRPSDKFYCLGDVAMKKSGIPYVERLNGHGRLVRGNHDMEKTSLYLEYFDEVYATRVLDGLILSHIPVHPLSIRTGSANVHGHVHSNVPAGHFGWQYLNVSLEVIAYRPLALEEVKQQLRKQQDPSRGYGWGV